MSMAGWKQGFYTGIMIVVMGAAFCRADGQATVPPPAAPAISLLPLLDFREADIKFRLQNLMSVLRDRNHEGWVLAAYPDPNTGRPLIGAGFSLDLTAVGHAQHDPLNSNQFLEPSSAELWQAAGLAPERLRQVLDEFNRNMETWGTEGYRRRIHTHRLAPQLTEEEATRLLRVSAVQAVLNAKAYCRNFDLLSGPAQMALSQLAFQMGVNLEEFVEFLSELNGDTSHRDLSRPDDGNLTSTDAEHWRNVQMTLIESQWARRYTVRAISVIAMFDPQYASDPRGAEARVAFVLPPPAPKRRRRSTARHTAK
jgi:hypothetical protein